MSQISDATTLDIPRLVKDKLQSPNLCFLFGAGASKAAGYPLMKELSTIALDRIDPNGPIHATLSRLGGITIEDQLIELYGQIRAPTLSKIPQDLLQSCIDHLLDVIYEECVKKASIEAHRIFIKSLMQHARSRKCMNILTTNYDMLLEWACDAERILCVNGFFGVQKRIFDASKFDLRPSRLVQSSRVFGHTSRNIDNEPYISIYKLHGSVSWISDGELIREVPVIPGSKRTDSQLMVYPTPQKITETLKSPYTELFTRMVEILNVKQTVLISLGFSFSDSHIKPMIEKCLADNTFILVVISKDMLPDFDSFTSFRNATIITEEMTISDGKEYKVQSNLWNFPDFINLFTKT